MNVQKKIYLTHEMFKVLYPILEEIDLLQGVIDKKTIDIKEKQELKKINNTYKKLPLEIKNQMLEKNTYKSALIQHSKGLGIDLVFKRMNDPVSYNSGINNPRLLKTKSKQISKSCLAKRLELAKKMKKLGLNDFKEKYWHFDLINVPKIELQEKQELEKQAKGYNIKLVNKSKLPLKKF